MASEPSEGTLKDIKLCHILFCDDGMGAIEPDLSQVLQGTDGTDKERSLTTIELVTAQVSFPHCRIAKNTVTILDPSTQRKGMECRSESAE